MMTEKSKHVENIPDRTAQKHEVIREIIRNFFLAGISQRKEINEAMNEKNSGIAERNERITPCSTMKVRKLFTIVLKASLAPSA